MSGVFWEEDPLAEAVLVAEAGGPNSFLKDHGVEKFSQDLGGGCTLVRGCVAAGFGFGCLLLLNFFAIRLLVALTDDDI